MFLYRSNRAERLVEQLGEVVEGARDPFEPETIVVQSRGMERWLAMRLADRLGVWANADFPFPRTLIERAATAVLGQAPGAEAFGERELTWSVAARLPALLGESDFAPLAHYLEGDADGALRIQLAQRIAGTFDDYLVYRPDWIAQWEAGGGAGWEPRLWRALVQGRNQVHPAARLRALVRALASDAPELSGFPRRVCLFGIAALPPLHVQVLAALSRHVELHLFVLSPSRQYFGDLPRRPDAGEGHPLLGALGALGRDFQDVLLSDFGPVELIERELFEEPQGGTLLSTLQADILDLHARGDADGELPRAPIADDDRSIAVHACHGPMREVEVLHDQLVEVLQDPAITPEDIVVMTPDIETYAPMIDAVFDQRSGRPRIPYSISHRRVLARSALADAFDALLGTLGGRMTASEVIDLLSAEPIRERFEIAPDELQTIRTWVEEAGVRWGVDAAHRAQEGQPPHAENTWRFGLERMLLGYAMEGRGRELFAGRLPYDALEGSAAELLGKLAEFCQQLFSLRERLSGPRTLSRWRDDLGELLGRMTRLPPSAAHQMQELRQALADLAERAERAGFEDAVPLATVRSQLEEVSDERLPTRGFLAGGVTFCQLVPLRSIPFRVVCLLGMGDEAFPRADRRVGFHRMARPGEPRRAGDRSPRDDDRYMFLEALLSARDRLLITYVGHGIHDNRVMPPSVVVGELFDAVHRGFHLAGDGATPPERAAIEARLRTDHRMHAFSAAYYTPGSELFSYAERYCVGARSVGSSERAPAFLEGVIDAGPDTLELSVEQLCNWISHPIRAFFRDRLGVTLGADLTPLRDREPLDLETLDRWQLGTDLLQLALDDVAVDAELLPAVRARGALPLGAVGEQAYGALYPQVQAVAGAVGEVCGGGRLPPLPVDLERGGVRITGVLHELYPGAQVGVTFSKPGRKRELSHWVRHVLLACLHERGGVLGYPRQSVMVSSGGERGAEPVTLRYAPLARPFEVLDDLLRVVRAAAGAALPFVHDAGRTYAERCLVGGAEPPDPELERRALREAAARFGGDFGELHDAYVAKVYPEFDALVTAAPGGLDFRTIARLVLTPMLAGVGDGD